MKKLTLTLLIFAILPCLNSFAAAPDLTKGESKPKFASHDWNLGPTGARGWMYSNKMETSEARQIYVTKVAPGSPAAKVLEIGDVILGVAGKAFSYDPRTEMGKAIGSAEAKDGKLSLMLWRKGKTEKVNVQLQVLGAYSKTAPFNCAKSQKVFDQGCAALAKSMKSGDKSKRHNWITKSLNALVLLASGKAEYMPLVKETVKEAANFAAVQNSTSSWYYGPVNILIAEYTLATGDKSFLPALEKSTMKVVEGQSLVGSWGHKFVNETKRIRGYGMMNAPGVPLTLSLILSRAAGVKNSKVDDAIRKSTDLIRFYVGKGSIPYGDHHPWIQTHDDNGKNGMAAVTFNLLNDSKATKYFSSMSVASHGAERDTGHTGNFFNMLWAMPSIAISGPNATGAWMQEFSWYYDLARQWDGTYMYQGAPKDKTDSFRQWDSTGAYLLAYAQATRSIYLTGKKHNLIKPISTSEAAMYIENGKNWGPRLRTEPYKSFSDSKLFEGLQSWSPVVRDRSAMELAKRKIDPTEKLIAMLKSDKLYARIGACQAVEKVRGRASGTIPELTRALKDKDLWLQIKAADALAAIGKPAINTAPVMLKMLAGKKRIDDPRSMLQRYLCFALFNSRGGLLSKSVEGINKDELFDAVKAGLLNDDGRARGAIKTVYKNLSFAELKPILPAIHQAIVEPAPSGIMFANEIRDAGLDLLAKHKVSEGLELCADYVRNMKQHGSQKRILTVLKLIESYGAHAQRVVPSLKETADYFEHKEKDFPKKLSIGKAKDVRKSIDKIMQATKKPELMSIKIN